MKRILEEIKSKIYDFPFNKEVREKRENSGIKSLKIELENIKKVIIEEGDTFSKDNLIEFNILVIEIEKLIKEKYKN